MYSDFKAQQVITGIMIFLNQFSWWFIELESIQ